MIKLRVRGDYACFTSEMKAERVSYSCLTPSAARGIISSVYWKPEINWIIDRIKVVNEIKFTNIRRNEVGKINKWNNFEYIDADKYRTQRSSLLLKDVCYEINAHFELVDKNDTNTAKHIEMFNRRLEKGQAYRQPFLGCKEFVAFCEPIEQENKSFYNGIVYDLGIMLYDIDFVKNAPIFYHCVMKDGEIKVERNIC